ncbi:hypothetical protein C0995_001509 [Termitomyces sp. Mi166|nr:hypothetical protein C0995_001509 [Termitomyces sp. Mi166\
MTTSTVYRPRNTLNTMLVSERKTSNRSFLKTLRANHREVFTPEVKILHKRQEIIHKMQTVVAPEIFSPRAVYDGNALMYASQPLKLPASGAGNVMNLVFSDDN